MYEGSQRRTGGWQIKKDPHSKLSAKDVDNFYGKGQKGKINNK